MRRLLKSIASGGLVGDVTTLEDGTAIEEVKQAYDELKKAVG
jgi:acetyl-CoA synthetase